MNDFLKYKNLKRINAWLIRTSLFSILPIIVFLAGCVQTKSIENSGKQYHKDSSVAYFPFKDSAAFIKIKVINPCKTGIFPQDGAFTAIEATKFEHGKQKTRINFIDPNSQMELIYFQVGGAWSTTTEKGIVYFLPFGYCSNSDADQKVSCFIFYEKEAYLAHLFFSCGEDKASGCKLQTFSSENNKIIPGEIKEELIARLSDRYRSADKFNY